MNINNNTTHIGLSHFERFFTSTNSQHVFQEAAQITLEQFVKALSCKKTLRNKFFSDPSYRLALLRHLFFKKSVKIASSLECMPRRPRQLQYLIRDYSKRNPNSFQDVLAVTNASLKQPAIAANRYNILYELGKACLHINTPRSIQNALVINEMLSQDDYFLKEIALAQAHSTASEALEDAVTTILRIKNKQLKESWVIELFHIYLMKKGLEGIPKCLEILNKYNNISPRENVLNTIALASVKLQGLNALQDALELIRPVKYPHYGELFLNVINHSGGEAVPRAIEMINLYAPQRKWMEQSVLNRVIRLMAYQRPLANIDTFRSYLSKFPDGSSKNYSISELAKAFALSSDPSFQAFAVELKSLITDQNILKSLDESLYLNSLKMRAKTVDLSEYERLEREVESLPHDMQVRAYKILAVARMENRDDDAAIDEGLRIAAAIDAEYTRYEIIYLAATLCLKRMHGIEAVERSLCIVNTLEVEENHATGYLLIANSIQYKHIPNMSSQEFFELCQRLLSP